MALEIYLRNMADICRQYLLWNSAGPGCCQGSLTWTSPGTCSARAFPKACHQQLDLILSPMIWPLNTEAWMLILKDVNGFYTLHYLQQQTVLEEIDSVHNFASGRPWILVITYWGILESEAVPWGAWTGTHCTSLVQILDSPWEPSGNRWRRNRQRLIGALLVQIFQTDFLSEISQWILYKMLVKSRWNDHLLAHIFPIRIVSCIQQQMFEHHSAHHLFAEHMTSKPQILF